MKQSEKSARNFLIKYFDVNAEEMDDVEIDEYILELFFDMAQDDDLKPFLDILDQYKKESGVDN